MSTMTGGNAGYVTYASNLAWLIRAICTYFWPPHDSGDRLFSARCRIVCALSGVTAAVGAVSGVISFPITAEFASPHAAAWTLAGPVVVLFAPLLVHKLRRADLGGAVLFGFLYPHLTFHIFAYDGLLWPVAPYLSAMPSLTFLIFGSRLGWAATALVVATLAYAGTQTLPGWVAVTLSFTTIGLAVAIFIFQREMEEAARHLIRLRRDAQQASQAKSDFLAQMSHEVRTPLNGVLGALQLLEDSKLDAGQAELLAAGHASGGMLLTMVNNILDHSKLIQKGITLETRAFAPNEIVAPVLLALTPAARERQVTLTSEIDPACPRGSPATPGAWRKS